VVGKPTNTRALWATPLAKASQDSLEEPKERNVVSAKVASAGVANPRIRPHEIWTDAAKPRASSYPLLIARG
jgi:hypothetical protein